MATRRRSPKATEAPQPVEGVKTWQPESPDIVAPQGYKWWSDVEMAAVDWAWTGMIPMGAMSLVMGAPGTTKSSLMAWVAAEFSKGDLPGDFHGTKSNVLWLSREDSARINLAPKLAVAKAGNVLLLDELEPATNVNVTSESGVKNLTALIENHQIKMVIVDPMMAFTESRFSQQTNTPAVMQMLTPLAALCAVQNIAVVGVVHTAKGKTKATIDSVAGSQGFTSTSRHVLIVGRRNGKYLTAPVKSNVARVGYGHIYTVDYVEAGFSTNEVTKVTKPITASKIKIGRPCIPSEVEQCLKDEGMTNVNSYVREILEMLNEDGMPMDTRVLYQRLLDADVFDIQPRQFNNVLAEFRELGYIAEDFTGFRENKHRLVWITRAGKAFINEDVDVVAGLRLPKTTTVILDTDD